MGEAERAQEAVGFQRVRCLTPSSLRRTSVASLFGAAADSHHTMRPIMPGHGQRKVNDGPIWPTGRRRSRVKTRRQG
jgi:hypothetical protein